MAYEKIGMKVNLLFSKFITNKKGFIKNNSDFVESLLAKK